MYLQNDSHKSPDEYHPSAASPDQAIQYTLGALTCITITISVIGNILVLLAIAKTKSLQRMNNTWYVSLAAADLARATLVMPLFTILMFTPEWEVSDEVCYTYHGLQLSLEVVVVFNLVAISVDRAYVITRPLVYQRVVTFKKMMMVVAFLWIASFAYGFLQILWWSDTENNNFFAVGQNGVATAVCQLRPSLIFGIVDLILTFVFPLLLMTAAYIQIFKIVHDQMKKMKRRISQAWDESSSAGTITYPRPRAESIVGGGGPYIRTIGNRGQIIKDANSDCKDNAKCKQTQNKEERNETTQGDVNPKHTMGSCPKTQDSNDIQGNVAVQIHEEPSELSDIDLEENQNNNSKTRVRKKPIVPGKHGVPQTTKLEVTNETKNPVITIETETLSPAKSVDPITEVNNNENPSSAGSLRTRSLSLPHLQQASLPILKPLDQVQPSCLKRHSFDKRMPLADKTAITGRRRQSVQFHLYDSTSTETINSRPQRTIRVVLRNEDTNTSRDANTTETWISGSSSNRTNHTRAKINDNPSHRHTQIWASRHFNVDHGFSYSSGTPRPSIVDSSPSTSTWNTMLSKRRRSLQRFRENKAVKMTMVVIGAFVLCWLPYEVTFMMLQTCTECVPVVAMQACVAVAFIASALNPFIYNFYSSEFRRALGRILCCRSNQVGPWM